MLTWQVRDTRRSDGTPVLGDELYNLTTEGVVHNTANATGYPADGSTPLSDDAADDVVIVDVPLTTTTDKNWANGPLAAPADPNIPAGQFPLSRMHGDDAQHDPGTGRHAADHRHGARLRDGSA